MKDFSALTKRGKIQRYGRVLIDSLQDYPIKVKSMKFISMHTKPVFRIYTRTGSYAAKFHDPTEHVYSQMMGELRFLDHISRNSNLCVETPLVNKRGDLVTSVKSIWLPETAHFALCSWVLGRQLKDETSIRSYYYLGISSATLHNVSASFRPGSEFSILTNNKVYYWDKETILSRKESKLLPKHRQDIFIKATQIAQKAIGKKWKSGKKPIVIHNDLHPCNIKLRGDRLSIFDFEDVTWGYDVQDIGTAMYHIRFREDYCDLLKAFKKGYEQVQKWPIENDEQLDSFIMARLLMFANYVVNYNIRPHKYLPEFELKLKTMLNKRT